jgi:hypothetical protein
MKKKKLLFILGFISIAILINISSVSAQVIIPNGGVFNLNGGTLTMSCNDLTVKGGGIFNVESGRVEDTRHITIEGTVNGGSGTILLSGTWTNNGIFNPGTSTVNFFDGCGVTNAVEGTGDSDGDGVPDGREGLSDRNNDGILDFLDPSRNPFIAIPSITTWGMIIMGGLLMLSGLLVLRKRARQEYGFNKDKG